MDIATTIRNLQTTYPDLYIPADPKEALQYLAAGYASAKSSLEGYQKQIPVSQSQHRRVSMVLPKKTR